MQYYIGLGSNIAPRQHIPLMLAALLELAPTLHVGRVVETAPVGVVGDAFLNVPVSLASTLAPQELKAWCSALEARLGRDRSDPASKVKSRTADLDILLWHEPGATAVAPQLLPAEPYMRPMLLELLAYMAVASGVEPPALDPGVALELDGLTVGERPLTITRAGARLRYGEGDTCGLS